MTNASDRIKEYGRAILIGVFLGVVMAVVFSLGFFVRDFVDVPPVFAVSNAADDEGYLLLDEVQTLLDRHYLRNQPNYVERQYGAIRGMLNSLGDRNTFFIEPPVARSESDVLAGTYGGIGINLQRGITGEFVVSPFPDGPAITAGIIDGDILVKINGEAVDLTTSQDAIDQMLRGEVDGESGVEITVRRPDGETFTAFIAFDVINIPSVLWRILTEDSEIGYIQLLRFTNRTPSELETAILELMRENASGLILDLRNNGGGLLQEAVDVASVFLDGGVVLIENTTTGEQEFLAEVGGLALDVPIIVLINNGTASAAELVAGALQDRGRALVVGQTSYGKGTIQQIFTLSDSSSIHVTSAEWFTPDGYALDGVGLIPDIVMIPDQTGRDVELLEAIRVLHDEQISMELN